MSQKIIIGGLCAVILVGGGVWFYQNQSEGGATSLMKSGEKSTSAQSLGEKKGILGELGDMVTGTFADIMVKGQSAYCTFDGIDPETRERINGSIYTSGENFAMEADTVMDDIEIRMNIIQNDRVMYMWSDQEDVMPAMKIDMSMFPDDSSEDTESPLAFLEDPESGVDYSCRTWIPRASAFEPPKDIEFYDMFGGMMGAFGAMMEGGFGGDMMGDAYADDEYYDSPNAGERY